MDNKQLAVVQEEKELGLVLTNDLKPFGQCIQGQPSFWNDY